MNTFKKGLIALSIVAVLICVIALVSQTQIQGQQGTGPVKPVVVVNEPSNPVPVTGTVNVGNFATGPLTIRNADEPGRSPYQETRSFFSGGNRYDITFSAVPVGKRLVIKRISGLIPLDRGNDLTESRLRANIDHYFNPVLLSTSGTLVTEAYQVNDELLAYSDENTTPQIVIRTSESNSQGFMGKLTLAGYFVELP